MGGRRVDTTTEAREDTRSGVRGADRRHLRLRPQRIVDAHFRQNGFFDPSDVVQVKYEMLRRHRVDRLPVTAVAALFGVSRQTFYAIARAFDAGGVAALVPGKSGPRGGWKCTNVVLDYAERWHRCHPRAEFRRLLDAIQRRFGVDVHPATLRLALTKREATRPPVGGVPRRRPPRR